MRATRSSRWTRPTRRCSRTWACSSTLAALLLVASSTHAALSDHDCLACHSERERAKSAHGSLGCTDCHAGITQAPHAAPVAKAVCTSCHADAQRALDVSVHGKSAGAEAPGCVSCHGAIHEFPPRSDPGSMIAKPNLPQTCGACHASPAFLGRHQLGLARPIEAYEGSVHGRALAAGNEKAASCSDCHGAHDIGKAKDAASRINRWNVPSTCGQCHEPVAKAFAASIHGQAIARGHNGAPVCTDC